MSVTTSHRLARPVAVLIALSLSAVACSGADEDTGLAATEISSGDVGEAERGEPAEALTADDASAAGDSDDESGDDESGDGESGDGEETDSGAEDSDDDADADSDDDADGNGNDDGNSSGGQPDVPGEVLDFGPSEGTELFVVGVRYDDTLNFRADPNPQASIVSSVAPLASADIVAAGEAWSAPSGVWWKVSIDGQDAWANQAYLGMEGGVTNQLSAVEADLGPLTFDDLEEAVRAVANSRASSGDPTSRVQFVQEPLAFDTATGSVIIDVLDLGDDSLKGERLRVWVENIYDETSGDEGAQDLLGVEVISVEATAICGRGVTGGGLCT